VRTDLLAHERVKAWMDAHPRERWAFDTLDERDPLRERVLASLLDGRDDEDASHDLALLVDALESRERAVRERTLLPPPGDGERRLVAVLVSRLRHVRSDERSFYRIYFCSPGGWAGFFETSNPLDVEKVARARDGHRPIQIVGEVVRRPRDEIVVLGGRVRVL